MGLYSLLPILSMCFLPIPGQFPPNPYSPSSSSQTFLPWICPNNGSFFDTNSCDPNVPFSCASNFKCRLAVKRVVGVAKGTNLTMIPGQEVRFICCESRQMGIREWLLDSGLSPAIFPQAPDSTLWQIGLKDPGSGNQVKVSENGAEMSVLSGDTGFANFSQLAEICFPKEEVPEAKGFLHILEAINQLAPVSSLRLHFDYPSFGVEQLDLLSLNQRFPRGFFQAVSNGFIPVNDFYRRQQVILVFKTDLPLANRTADIERWMGWSSGKFPKLMWENGSGMAGLLGKPLAGFMFNLTTRGSIFPVSIESTLNYPSKIVGNNETNNKMLAYDPGLLEATQKDDAIGSTKSSPPPNGVGNSLFNSNQLIFIIFQLFLFKFISANFIQFM